MIVLLVVTQNESDLLRWNIRHHLEWGIDHVAVADNRSSDATPDVVREFGNAVSHRVFDDFHVRQQVRISMLDDLRSRHHVDWVAVSDTDELLWSEHHDPRSLVAGVPSDVVAVNFDSKSFVPTVRDDPALPVFAARRYRTSSGESPLHTDYVAGKTWYRSEWLTTLTHEHWTPEVPHAQYRHPERAVHHYMIQDEDHFVVKVSRLIAWAPEPRRAVDRVRWRLTPPHRRPLPRWMSPWKKEWWSTYQSGGEEAVRAYYRDVYTLGEDRLAEALERGWVVEDGAFADWATARLVG